MFRSPAIVEFEEPSEAKRAFTRLAYSKFKSVPLFLEWAPENMLAETRAQNNVEAKKEEIIKSAVKVETNEHNTKEKILEEPKDDDEEPESDTTLFVKNLNFITTDEGLRKVNCFATTFNIRDDATGFVELFFNIKIKNDVLILPFLYFSVYILFQFEITQYYCDQKVR